MLCLISPKKHSHKIAPFKTLLFTGTPCKFCTLLKVELNGSTIHCSATGYLCHKRLHRNVQATGESQKYFRAELMPLAFFQHLWSPNTRPHLFSNAATEFQYSFSFCMPEHCTGACTMVKEKASTISVQMATCINIALKNSLDDLLSSSVQDTDDYPVMDSR
jgi:hypothetical protein